MCVLYVKGRSWYEGFQYLISWSFILTYWLLFTKDKLNILIIWLENISGYFPSFKHKSPTFQGGALKSNIGDA